MDSYYITTPIYYVNGAPHMGHAYTTIAADVLARHHRQRGIPTFFLTGTDEHGEPVADAALAQGVTPQELADANAAIFKTLPPRLNAANDFFIRTTDEEHKRCVQEILTRVKDNGHVYSGIYEGLYCPRCADFKSENEIEDGDRCPIHHIELILKQEENWFFRLSTFQEPLEKLYADRPDWVMPQTRFNEARAFIASGLEDVSLSRKSLTWGVQVPWDTDHVFYVWFDALLNYYTALGYARDGEDLTDQFWPPQLHVIGKDILKFHCVFWPAMLMAADIELPEHIFVHGFLLMDGEKMSKSLGNVLDPFTIIDRFSADALRFYVMRDVTFGQDGSVSTVAFEERYEKELANELGNLASRTIAMVHRYRGGTVPAVALEASLTTDFDGLIDDVRARFDIGDLTGALEQIWARVRRLNRYVEERKPWELAKDEGRAAELDEVLASLTEGLRALAVLLWAYMPQTIETLLGALNASDTSLAVAPFGSGSLAEISELAPLFPKQQ